jgi:hypothetical protein
VFALADQGFERFSFRRAQTDHVLLDRSVRRAPIPSRRG